MVTSEQEKSHEKHKYKDDKVVQSIQPDLSEIARKRRKIYQVLVNMELRG